MTIGRTSSNAKRLRRDMTDAERLLWKHLRGRNLAGLKFRRQATVGSAIPDFICLERRLIIEVDGGQHSEEADADRTEKLEALECHVIRFWNHEVLENIDGVLQRIVAEAEARPARWRFFSR